MYELNQQFTQSDLAAKVAAKVAAASQYDLNDKLQRGRIVSSAEGSPASPMDQEYQRLCEAMSDLDSQVGNLLARIAPVLQPGSLSDGKDAAGAQTNSVEAAPSEMRMKLINARKWVESISAKIATVRYTIEL